MAANNIANSSSKMRFSQVHNIVFILGKCTSLFTYIMSSTNWLDAITYLFLCLQTHTAYEIAFQMGFINCCNHLIV